MKPRAPKKPRISRQGTVRLELNERDFEILFLIGTVGYLSSEQIARVFFPSADRARRRLRRLFDAGLISFLLLQTTSPNIVRLTQKGMTELDNHFPDACSHLHLPGIIREADIPEHLLLVDTRLFAVAYGQAKNAPLSHWAGADSSLIQKLGLREKGLYPQAVAEFSPANSPAAYVAVELRTGNGRTGTGWSKRLHRYYEAATAEDIDGLWIVTEGAKRAEELRLLVERAGLGEFARVFHRAELVQKPLGDRPKSVPDRTEGSNSRKNNLQDQADNIRILGNEVRHE